MSTRQGTEAKTRILDAAEALMGRSGYAGTAVSSLCKLCGLSASAIYFHFGSKEGVMAAALERGINRYLDQAEQVANQPLSSPEMGLRELFKAIEAKPQALRLAIILGMEEGAEGGIGGTRVAFVRKRGRALIASLIADMVYADLESDKVKSLTTFVLAALDGAVILEQLDGLPLTAVMEPVFNLLKKTEVPGSAEHDKLINRMPKVV